LFWKGVEFGGQTCCRPGAGDQAAHFEKNANGGYYRNAGAKEFFFRNINVI
jgi:hypothetical protein